MLEQLVAILSTHALWAGQAFVLVVLILCGLGLPMPEDVVLVTGGVLAWLAAPLEPVTVRGMLTHPGVLAMAATGLLGILLGDSVIFYGGRRFGARVAEIPLLRRLVTPAKQARVEDLLRRRGRLVVLVARFLPGLRAPTYFTVGHSRFPYWQFLLFDGIAALLSAPLWVFLGFWFGDDIRLAVKTAGKFGNVFVAAAVLVVAWFVVRALLQRRRQAAADSAPVKRSPVKAVEAPDPAEPQG